jgi:hypothetical protein
MSDLNTGTSANKAPSNQADKIEWSANLFEPLLTLEQIQESKPAFQDEAVKRRMMLVVLTKTPEELLQIAQNDPDTFTEIFEMAGEYLERMEMALELATAAHARVDDMEVSE